MGWCTDEGIHCTWHWLIAWMEGMVDHFYTRTCTYTSLNYVHVHVLLILKIITQSSNWKTRMSSININEDSLRSTQGIQLHMTL